MARVLEVCVDPGGGGLAAARGSATRPGLCANLILGGTTPSPALFDAVRAATGLPVHVLIRPRFGDFLYTEWEYRIMCREVEEFARRGANGVVIGALRPDGSLDPEKPSGLIAAAKGLRVTLHRAFDVCRDPMEALEQAAGLGVDTVLTSGQQADAWAGRALIGQLLAAGRAEILIGGGVNAAVIRDFRQLLPEAESFHLSGKQVLESGMTYRNPAVSMGLPGISEYQLWRTGEAAVRRAADALWED